MADVIATALVVVVTSLLHAIFQAAGDVIRHRDLARLKQAARGRKIQPLKSKPFRFGILLVLVGFIFQVVALHFGRVVTVQTIAVSALVFLLLFQSLLSDQKLHRNDWWGSALVMVGIVVFVLTVHPTDIKKDVEIDYLGWGIAFLIMLVIAVLIMMLAPSLPPGASSMVFGAGAGAAVGLGAGMISALGIIWRVNGFGSLFTTWLLYAFFLVEGLRLFLLVRGLQRGPVTSSVGAFVLVSPVVSWLIGAWLLSEPINTGPAFYLGVPLSFILLVVGVVILVRTRTIEEVYSLKGMSFQASW
ncbi:MAG: DMT family transporter [Actinobacteria bacterium]|nr:DMT family transporter [Actinomycetota bacterium]